MSLITRSYRRRAYPNGAQRRLLDRWFGATRWLWNTALEIRSEAYRGCGLCLTVIDFSRWLTQWKRTAGHAWLAEVPATALTQCLRDQERAFSRFFAFSVIAIEDLNVRGLACGRSARAIQDAAFGELRRQLRYKSDWYGPLLLEVDRWYASSKHCSMCRFRLDELRLDQRQWTCPKCGTCHDRDINAARNLLTQGVRQLAGRDDRDLRVDAGDACPEEDILVQVLAEEARSGHHNRAGPGPVRLG